jgi:hypothetical protein
MAKKETKICKEINMIWKRYCAATFTLFNELFHPAS